MTPSVSPDGGQVAVDPTDDSGTQIQPPIVLIENWSDELQRLVPTS